MILMRGSGQLLNSTGRVIDEATTRSLHSLFRNRLEALRTVRHYWEYR
jgi:hypothetical protein